MQSIQQMRSKDSNPVKFSRKFVHFSVYLASLKELSLFSENYFPLSQHIKNKLTCSFFIVEYCRTLSDGHTKRWIDHLAYLGDFLTWKTHKAQHWRMHCPNWLRATAKTKIDRKFKQIIWVLVSFVSRRWVATQHYTTQIPADHMVCSLLKISLKGVWAIICYIHDALKWISNLAGL